MANVFDIVNARLFSVFSRDDRRTNYELLAYIYGLYNGKDVRFAIPKSELIGKLSAYVSRHAFALFENEEGDSISTKDARTKAISKINQFKSCGYLLTEATHEEGLGVSYALDDQAAKIVKLLIEISGGEASRVGYSGYFYAIYRLLVPFEMDKARDSFEQVKRLTGELFVSLQGTISAIKRFIDRLLQNEELTPQEILDLLLNEYERQGIVSIFNDLKGKDNPSKYTLAILDELEELREKKLDEFALSYAGANASPEYVLATKDALREDLDACIERFLSVNDLVSAIDEKNARFYSSSVKRLRYLLNTSKDASGRIEDMLKALITCPEKSDYGEVLGIYSQGFLDEESLYSEPPDRLKEILGSSIPPEVDPSLAAEQAALLFASDEFSKEKIDAYVLSLLEGKDEVRSGEIPLNEEDDVYRFLLMQMFSGYEDVNYSIDYGIASVSNGSYLVRDFVVHRKEIHS